MQDLPAGCDYLCGVRHAHYQICDTVSFGFERIVGRPDCKVALDVRRRRGEEAQHSLIARKPFGVRHPAEHTS